MSNNFFYLGVICSMTVLLICGDSCPDGFLQLDDGVCVIERQTSNDFCLANKLCADYTKQTGQLVFLVGSNNRYLEDAPKKSSAWSSVNQLLVRGGSDASKWTDADPRLFRSNNTGNDWNWQSPAPRGMFPVAYLRRVSWQLRDVKMRPGLAMQVYCEYVRPLENEKLLVIPFSNSYPESIVSVKSTDEEFDGCHNYVNNVHSKLQCVYE